MLLVAPRRPLQRCVDITCKLWTPRECLAKRGVARLCTGSWLALNAVWHALYTAALNYSYRDTDVPYTPFLLCFLSQTWSKRTGINEYIKAYFWSFFFFDQRGAACKNSHRGLFRHPVLRQAARPPRRLQDASVYCLVTICFLRRHLKVLLSVWRLNGNHLKRGRDSIVSNIGSICLFVQSNAYMVLETVPNTLFSSFDVNQHSAALASVGMAD